MLMGSASNLSRRLQEPELRLKNVEDELMNTKGNVETRLQNGVKMDTMPQRKLSLAGGVTWGPVGLRLRTPRRQREGTGSRESTERGGAPVDAHLEREDSSAFLLRALDA